MRSPSCVLSFTTEASISDGCVVIQGAADDKVKLPTGAATDFVVVGLAKVEGGGSVASGQGIDVVTCGVWPAKASGSITRGDRVVVADSTGKVKTGNYAVAATAVVGYALESASTGERVAVLVMPGAEPNLVIQGFTADGAITANTAVKIGSADNKVATATADPTTGGGVIGVALNTVVDGATVYVCISGVVPCALQGNVTRGNNLTVGDASGGLKAAAPTAGNNATVAGIAMSTTNAPGPANVLVRPGMMQG